MSTTDTIEHDFEESNDLDTDEKLFRVSEYTTETGHVECEIQDYEESEDGTEMVVKGMLPTGRTITERMDFPETDSDEYKFVRLCNEAGFDLASAPQTRGERVEVRKDEDGEAEFHAPEGAEDRIISPHGWAIIGLVFLPITIIITIFTDHIRISNPEDHEIEQMDARFDAAFIAGILLTAWGVGVLKLLEFVGVIV